MACKPTRKQPPAPSSAAKNNRNSNGGDPVAAFMASASVSIEQIGFADITRAGVVELRSLRSDAHDPCRPDEGDRPRGAQRR